jgi:F420-0:gamma-glutamyl ligase-like protein
MARYQALALTTTYWMPGTNAVDAIVETIEGKVQDGDFVVVSEKALSTAAGNIVDEDKFRSTLTAKFLASLWMRYVWGYVLGIACRFGLRLLKRVRSYPLEAGAKHKQVALLYAGFLQALMFGSEGGIDGSNLPFSFVSLPLKSSQVAADAILTQIQKRLRKEVTILIVDTDKTYSIGNFHFTPRPKPMQGISSRLGVFAYLSARWLRLKRRPTPLAVAGRKISTEEALTVANVADRARGPGSGATVWDMAARFRVKTTEVTWDMLTRVKHKPIVLVRRAIRNPQG